MGIEDKYIDKFDSVNNGYNIRMNRVNEFK